MPHGLRGVIRGRPLARASGELVDATIPPAAVTRSSSIKLVICKSASMNLVNARMIAIPLSRGLRSFTYHWDARASVQRFYESLIRTPPPSRRHLAVILPSRWNRGGCMLLWQYHVRASAAPCSCRT